MELYAIHGLYYDWKDHTVGGEAKVVFENSVLCHYLRFSNANGLNFKFCKSSAGVSWCQNAIYNGTQQILYTFYKSTDLNDKEASNLSQGDSWETWLFPWCLLVQIYLACLSKWPVRSDNTN